MRTVMPYEALVGSGPGRAESGIDMLASWHPPGDRAQSTAGSSAAATIVVPLDVGLPTAAGPTYGPSPTDADRRHNEVTVR